MLKSQDILKLLENIPEGYLKPNDKFFNAGTSNILKPYRKLGAINSTDIDDGTEDTLTAVVAEANADKEIFCNVLKCNLVFDSIASYQSHYNSIHRFICSECKKSLPTEHLLDLHLTECHDSYFEVRIERGERLYKCYLEECKQMFSNASERRQHCIEDHKFPSNFRFEQIPLKRKKTPKIESEYPTAMEVVEDLKPVVSSNNKDALKNFSFGHQKEKTFQLKNSSAPRNPKPQAGKILEDMDSIREALDSV